MIIDDYYHNKITTKRKHKLEKAFTRTRNCLSRLSRKRLQCFKETRQREFSLKQAILD